MCINLGCWDMLVAAIQQGDWLTGVDRINGEIFASDSRTGHVEQCRAGGSGADSIFSDWKTRRDWFVGIGLERLPDQLVRCKFSKQRTNDAIPTPVIVSVE